MAGGDAERGGGEPFTDEERALMRERAREVRTARRRGGDAREEGERDVLAKLAEMDPADRAIAERLHALVSAIAPELVPRTWYGMPAYARDGRVVCFFQAAGRFKVRYATLGFGEEARLDDGALWATSFAILAIDARTEARVTELLLRAVGRSGG